MAERLSQSTQCDAFGGTAMEHSSQPERRSGLIRYLLEQLESRLFADEDALARARGWTIRRTRGGFGRVYRDPRWDGLRRGSGVERNAEVGR